MSFETFVETAWSDHADRPHEVADRLAFAWHACVAADEQGRCKADLDEFGAAVNLSDEPRREHAE
jgi:hypothetical protein